MNWLISQGWDPTVRHIGTWPLYEGDIPDNHGEFVTAVRPDITAIAKRDSQR